MLQILTTKFYLEKVKETLPDWDITITPNDLLENAIKYDRVQIKLVNTKNDITRECSIPLMAITNSQGVEFDSWYRSGIITANIASLVCRGTKNSNLKLDQKISSYLTSFHT